MKKVLNQEQIGLVLDILEQMHPEARCALDHKNTYELIVAVALSAQTTDVSVNKVTPALFDKYPTPEILANAKQEDVEELIRAIGLYKNKSSNIIKLAKKLCEDFDGEVPSNFSKLISLPGVGRKTANVVLAEGFNIPRIAVDTHVFRVANRIGLTDEPDVNKTEESLMARIPEDKWIRAHRLIIFHGRKCCTARNPKCEECGLKDICLNRQH